MEDTRLNLQDALLLGEGGGDTGGGGGETSKREGDNRGASWATTMAGERV